MSSLENAIKLAASVHAGQKDKAGQPYILHPLRVMLQMDSELERITAVLHDVIEDSDMGFDDLRREGFSKPVIEAVESVTKRPQEDYEDFVKRAGRHPVGKKVKLADLKDNLDFTRLKKITDKDVARAEKYLQAVEILEASAG